jgi:hypothetical protein
MRTTRRVTADLPASLVEEATRASGKSVTATLVDGLQLVKRAQAWERARPLKGKIDLDLDLDLSRERRRR